VIGAGTVINPIIKIVTTVAILAAVYFFAIKPVLDTTEDVTEKTFGVLPNQSELQQTINEALEGVPNAQEIQIPEAAKKAQKLGDCMTAASGDVDKINRCVEKFGP
jgi:hypothetical protein